MLTKDKIQELINHMPETFSADDLIGKIILMQRIEESEAEIDRGEGIDWEELKKEMDTW